MHKDYDLVYQSIESLEEIMGVQLLLNTSVSQTVHCFTLMKRVLLCVKEKW